MTAKFLMTAGLFATLIHTHAQTIEMPFTGPNNPWDMTLFDFTQGKYEYKGKADLKVETYAGKESVYLQPGTILHTRDLKFADGILEFELNFPDKRNFPGVGFRVKDLDNFETFYIGAQKGGQPDATRYTPVFNGQQAWQLYYGDGHTKAVPYQFNTWHHIKLDIHGMTADVFIDDMQKPLYTITDLKHEWRAGDILLYSDESAVHFADASYTPRPSKAPAPNKVPANGENGVVTQWQVSNAVSRALFEKKYQLTADIKKELTWNTRSSDPSGILNLYRFAVITQTNSTMVARVTIESQKDQVKALTFGFSDEVSIYLNDNILYSGSDVYGSRDYQFIGTMGYFDTIFIPLKKGKNELWFVVSEYFGGWGVEAKFQDMKGITLK